MQKKEYEPYGIEWRKVMMKLRKYELLDLLKKAYQENDINYRAMADKTRKIPIINIDNVDLNNLYPNKNDPCGWIDKTTKKNYWLIEKNGDLQISPKIAENIVEIRPL